jgi:hypothetical protein
LRFFVAIGCDYLGYLVIVQPSEQQRVYSLSEASEFPDVNGLICIFISFRRLDGFGGGIAHMERLGPLDYSQQADHARSLAVSFPGETGSRPPALASERLSRLTRETGPEHTSGSPASWTLLVPGAKPLPANSVPWNR